MHVAASCAENVKKDKQSTIVHSSQLELKDTNFIHLRYVYNPATDVLAASNRVSYDANGFALNHVPATRNSRRNSIQRSTTETVRGACGTEGCMVNQVLSFHIAITISP